jgi:hypothetical protein
MAPSGSARLGSRGRSSGTNVNDGASVCSDKGAGEGFDSIPASRSDRKKGSGSPPLLTLLLNLARSVARCRARLDPDQARRERGDKNLQLSTSARVVIIRFGEMSTSRGLRARALRLPCEKVRF